MSLNRTPLLVAPCLEDLLESSLSGLKVTIELLLLGFFLIVPPSGESQLNPCSTDCVEALEQPLLLLTDLSLLTLAELERLEVQVTPPL